MDERNDSKIWCLLYNGPLVVSARAEFRGDADNVNIVHKCTHERSELVMEYKLYKVREWMNSLRWYRERSQQKCENVNYAWIRW